MVEALEVKVENATGRHIPSRNMHDESAVVDSLISEARLVAHLRPVGHFLAHYFGVDSLVHGDQALCDFSFGIDTQVQSVSAVGIEGAEIQRTWAT